MVSKDRTQEPNFDGLRLTMIAGLIEPYARCERPCAASFDPSSVRLGHRTVYSARREADFVMPSLIQADGYYRL
jgi:hypothetical protein